MKEPVILDFDKSAGPIANALAIDLQAWQERMRFACSWRYFREMATLLDHRLPRAYGPVLLGSGDYHHISHLLVCRMQRLLAGRGLTVVVIDNHPDNMRFPFGIHCGSWISHTAALPFVDHVHVIGITSQDIGPCHAFENRLLPLYRSRLTYWSTGVNVKWAHRIGLKQAFFDFANVEDLVSAFISEQYHQSQPVYLSIDKDALAPDCLRTNWDQGVMQERHVTDLLMALGPRLKGCDITGDVSDYSYSSPLKRLLSRLDGQQPVSPNDLPDWQRQQRAFNSRILGILSRYMEDLGVTDQSA